jgi:hypothetical protein
MPVLAWQTEGCGLFWQNLVYLKLGRKWVNEFYPLENHSILKIFAEDNRYLVQTRGCPYLGIIKG